MIVNLPVHYQITLSNVTLGYSPESARVPVSYLSLPRFDITNFLIFVNLQGIKCSFNLHFSESVILSVTSYMY